MPSAKPQAPRFAMIDKGTVHERVYIELREALMVGGFAPGQTITVRMLAESFGTSPMPVREAIRRLVAERAFSLLPNRSVVVPRLSSEQLDDLTGVRLLIEGEIAYRAAQRITQADLSTLEQSMASMWTSIRKRRTEDYLSINRDFHFTVYRAAGSTVAMPIIESLWLQIGPMLNYLLRMGDVAEELAMKHHIAWFDALKQGDSDRARQAVVADIEEAASYLKALRVEIAGPFPSADD